MNHSLSVLLLCAALGCKPSAPPPSDAGAAPSCSIDGLVPAGPFVGWFEELPASRTGVDVLGEGGAASAGNGVGVDDLDGDGLLDLVVTTGGAGLTRVFHNEGDFHFTPRASLEAALGATLADLDGDGDPELLLTGAGVRSLYENVQGQLVARPASGLEGAQGRSVGALAGDLDGDGKLELYVLDDRGNRLFRNLGGLRFEDLTATSGAQVSWPAEWTGALWDFDTDGAPDLLVQLHTSTTDPVVDQVQMQNVSDRLLRNLRTTPLSFTDVAALTGLAKQRSSMGAVVSDFDGDGRLDLYVSNFGRSPLFLARADGTFVDEADLLGVGAARFLATGCGPQTQDRRCLLSHWGSAALDADHDGRDDLMVVNGFPGSDRGEQPATTLRALASGGFEAVETSLGCPNARALVPADLDADGTLDLVVTTVGGPVRFFRGTAPPRSWLRVKLAGSTSNSRGVGAVVTATFADGHTVMRAIGVGGVIFASAPPEAFFTIADVPLTGLDVRWPSGRLQHLAPASFNQTLTVAEP